MKENDFPLKLISIKTKIITGDKNGYALRSYSAWNYQK